MKPEEREVVTMEPLLLSASDAAKALGGISVDLLQRLPVRRVRLGKRVLFSVDDDDENNWVSMPVPEAKPS